MTIKIFSIWTTRTMTISSDKVRGHLLPVLKGEREVALEPLPQLPLPPVTLPLSLGLPHSPGDGLSRPLLGDVEAVGLEPLSL